MFTHLEKSPLYISGVGTLKAESFVPTRLRKLASDQWHAIVLASAGLKRLGLVEDGAKIKFEHAEFFSALLPRDVFLPAGGQGVIALQIRSDDQPLKDLVEGINHFDTRLALRAEREFLRLLEADCNQPVGVLATIEGATMNMRAQIFAVGASTPREAFVEGRSEDAEKLAAELLKKINGE